MNPISTARAVHTGAALVTNAANTALGFVGPVNPNGTPVYTL